MDMRVILGLWIFTLSLVGFSQQTESVDFKHVSADISIEPRERMVFGRAVYDFAILKSVDSIFLDAQNMKFSKVVLNGSEVEYSNDSKKIWIKYSFKPSRENKLEFSFKVHPKKALYFVESDDYTQIWTQGQGKYTSNWLPSLDDTNDKIEFDLTVAAPEGFEVIANGELLEKNDGRYNFDMKHPMSSYLVALVIGKYDKKTEHSKSGISLELYYYPEDSLKVEPTYRYSKQMFDFLENEIGFGYPWQVYKQVPVHDFLYSGMENTSCTIFADSYMVDAVGFNDKNYVNVNAHELAHQWFGDLVTAKSGEHHWLQEGFATYYALLAERDIFGKNYYYWRLYEYAQELKDQDRQGQGTSLLNPKSSSLTFYKRGCWVLHALKEKVGEEAFKEAVKAYLEKFQFKSVETSDFISEVEKSSGTDLKPFVDLWIMGESFPYDEAHELLLKSKFIQEYEMVDCEADNSKCTYYLDSYISDEAKIKIIQQKPTLITSETFKNSLEVRQVLAQVLTTIPENLKADYEGLLMDASYYTKETALYNLWVNFPENRAVYLDETAGIDGLSYNVKLLWLALALNTENYKQEEKEQIYNQLVHFTSPNYGFEVRMNAFQYLLMMQGCNEECLENLEQAQSHHNWRMSKFAKEQLERLNKKN